MLLKNTKIFNKLYSQTQMLIYQQDIEEEKKHKYTDKLKLSSY